MKLFLVNGNITTHKPHKSSIPSKCSLLHSSANFWIWALLKLVLITVYFIWSNIQERQNVLNAYLIWLSVKQGLALTYWNKVLLWLIKTKSTPQWPVAPDYADFSGLMLSLLVGPPTNLEDVFFKRRVFAHFEDFNGLQKLSDFSSKKWSSFTHLSLLLLLLLYHFFSVKILVGYVLEI